MVYTFNLLFFQKIIIITRTRGKVIRKGFHDWTLWAELQILAWSTTHQNIRSIIFRSSMKLNVCIKQVQVWCEIIQDLRSCIITQGWGYALCPWELGQQEWAKRLWPVGLSSRQLFHFSTYVILLFIFLT